MKKLRMREGSLFYSGVFIQPSFSLWKRDGVAITEEIYKLFLPFDIDLSNIDVTFNLENLAETSVTVNLDDFADVTLSPLGVEAGVEGFISDRTVPFFELLEVVSTWLRSSEDSPKYRTHIFEYTGHGVFDEGTAQDVLNAFGTKRLTSIKQDLPSGLIFNWIDIQTGGRAHIEVDESLDIVGGLYLRWLVMLSSDDIAYKNVGLHSVNVMKGVLAEVGIDIEVDD
jgi:hypothetical protein